MSTEYNSPILNSKIIKNTPSEEPIEFVDLLSNIWEKENENFSLIPYDIHIGKRDEEMRMDLICYRLYGSPEWIHHLCKYNNIKNPFDIRAGDYIRYPKQEDLENKAKELEETKKWIEGKKIVKIIVIPKRLVNIVVA
jgi:hypothetical protein